MEHIEEISQLTHLSKEAEAFLTANIKKIRLKKGEEILSISKLQLPVFYK